MGMADEVRRSQDQAASRAQSELQRQEVNAQELVRIMNRLAPEFAEGAKSLGIKTKGGILGPRGWIASENLICPAYPEGELKRFFGRKVPDKNRSIVVQTLNIMVYPDGSWSLVTADNASAPPKKVPLPRLFHYMPEEDRWRQELTRRMHDLANGAKF